MRLIFLIVLLTAGCDQLDKAMLQYAGWEEVALSSQPFELDAQGRTFTSKDQMKVLGTSSVCAVLKTDYPLAPQPQMDKEYRSLLQGAKISATLTSANESKYQFDSLGQAWSRYGVISSSEELSACVSPGCECDIPDGTVIKSVHFQSDRPLHVLGAFWKSSPKIDGPKG